MSRPMTFRRMVKILAACQCYYLGKQSIAQIAKSASVSESTIRRWLKEWPF